LLGWRGASAAGTTATWMGKPWREVYQLQPTGHQRLTEWRNWEAAHQQIRLCHWWGIGSVNGRLFFRESARLMGLSTWKQRIHYLTGFWDVGLWAGIHRLWASCMSIRS
jgi:hypothetical protein